MKYYLSVASVFKNESWNLKEWILHYKHHGVDHIYLVNDGSTDDFEPILEPFIREGFVTLFHNSITERYTGRQTDVNNKYFLPVCHETQWIAQIDLDEFLYSPVYVNLKEILKDYENYGTVETNWVWFNSNDHLHHPAAGLVQGFTSRAPYKDRVWMTHRSQSATNGAEEPEWFNLWAPKQIANTKFGVQSFNIHKIFTGGPNINLSFVGRPDDPLLLNAHYQIQSREFWEKVKMTRGALNNWYTPDARGWHTFYSLDVGDITDTTLAEQNKEITL
jgi:glycosyltransferase involved in cell wall biosynthesis